MRSVECPSARGGDATRRRGARKATRARARGFASRGDGRYSDRAAGREGARSACAAPFRSPRSRRWRHHRGVTARARAAESGGGADLAIPGVRAARDPHPPPDIHLRRGAETSGARPGGRTDGSPGIRRRRGTPHHTRRGADFHCREMGDFHALCPSMASTAEGQKHFPKCGALCCRLIA